MDRIIPVDRPEESWDLSGCACLEVRADLGEVSLDLEGCVGRTDPLDRRDLPMDLNDGIASESIPDRATFATRNAWSGDRVLRTWIACWLLG